MNRFKAAVLVILSLIPLTLVQLGVALSNQSVLNNTGMVFINIVVIIIFVSAVANYFLVIYHEKLKKNSEDSK